MASPPGARYARLGRVTPTGMSATFSTLAVRRYSSNSAVRFCQTLEQTTGLALRLRQGEDQQCEEQGEHGSVQ